MQHPAVLENLNPCSRCQKSYCPDCLVELKGNRFCAVCKGEAVKDMQSGVTGTDLALASIGRRFLALWLDGLIQGVLMIPLFFLLVFTTAKAQSAGAGGQAAAAGIQIVMQLVFMAISLCYEGLFLQLKSATPGKMALGLRVVTPDGDPVPAGQAWVRPLVRGLLGFCILVDYLPAFFRKDKCTLHDLAARTRVVKVN
jgi:uncharacterized RDD family membrane protein YckC